MYGTSGEIVVRTWGSVQCRRVRTYVGNACGKWRKSGQMTPRNRIRAKGTRADYLYTTRACVNSYCMKLWNRWYSTQSALLGKITYMKPSIIINLLGSSTWCMRHHRDICVRALKNMAHVMKKTKTKLKAFIAVAEYEISVTNPWERGKNKKIVACFQMVCSTINTSMSYLCIQARSVPLLSTLRHAVCRDYYYANTADYPYCYDEWKPFAQQPTVASFFVARIKGRRSIIPPTRSSGTLWHTALYLHTYIHTYYSRFSLAWEFFKHAWQGVAAYKQNAQHSIHSLLLMLRKT